MSDESESKIVWWDELGRTRPEPHVDWRALADDLATALDRVMDVSDPDCDIREPALRALARYRAQRGGSDE